MALSPEAFSRWVECRLGSKLAKFLSYRNVAGDSLLHAMYRLTEGDVDVIGGIKDTVAASEFTKDGHSLSTTALCSVVRKLEEPSDPRAALDVWDTTKRSKLLSDNPERRYFAETPITDQNSQFCVEFEKRVPENFIVDITTGVNKRIFLTGPFQAGKTSLSIYVVNTLKKAGFRFWNCNFTGAGNVRNNEQAFVRQITTRLDLDTIATMDELRDVLAAKGDGRILVMDELQYLFSASLSLASRFLSIIRELTDTGALRAFLGVGTTVVAWLKLRESFLRQRVEELALLSQVLVPRERLVETSGPRPLDESQVSPFHDTAVYQVTNFAYEEVEQLCAAWITEHHPSEVIPAAGSDDDWFTDLVEDWFHKTGGFAAMVQIYGIDLHAFFRNYTLSRVNVDEWLKEAALRLRAAVKTRSFMARFAESGAMNIPACEAIMVDLLRYHRQPLDPDNAAQMILIELGIVCVEQFGSREVVFSSPLVEEQIMISIVDKRAAEALSLCKLLPGGNIDLPRTILLAARHFDRTVVTHPRAVRTVAGVVCPYESTLHFEFLIVMRPCWPPGYVAVPEARVEGKARSAPNRVDVTLHNGRKYAIETKSLPRLTDGELAKGLEQVRRYRERTKADEAVLVIYIPAASVASALDMKPQLDAVTDVTLCVLTYSVGWSEIQLAYEVRS